MRSRLLLSNLSSLALALFLGVVIWVVAVNTENPLRTEDNFPPGGIAVELTNVPEGLVALTGGGQRVSLRIRAPENLWPRMNPNRFRAWVDLEGLEPGLHDVDVQVEQAQPGSNQIRILDHSPETISVRLDQVVEEEMPVQVTVVDRASMPTSYQILTPTVSPPTVTLRGPSTKITEVDRVEARVEASGSRASVQVETTVQLLNRSGGVIETGPASTDVQVSPDETVEVMLPIQARQGYRELIVQPVVVGEPERGYWISDIEASPRTISVVGLPGSVSALSSTVQTEPIDVTGLQAGRLTRRVRVQLPENVSPLEGDRLVSVTVEIEALRSSQRIAVTPEVSGLEAGLQVDRVAPETIDVLVEGPVSELEDVTSEDIVAVIDLTDLREGTHLIEPRITPPGSLAATSSIPTQVEVTLGVAIDSRQFSRPVRAEGVPSGLRAVVNPETISVTILGPSFELDTLDPEAISPTVDVEGRDIGTYILTPTLTVDEPFSITQMTPPQVNVTLEPGTSVIEIERRLNWRGLQSGTILNLVPSEVLLTVRGPGSPESVRETLLTDPAFRAVVDVSGLGSGTYTLTPQVNLPTGFELLDVEPDEISARLSRQ